jgi:hypothetical protein
MRENGCQLSFLWSDRHGFYRNLGYEPSGSFRLFKPPASLLSDAAPDCEVLPFSPERLPEIVKIHERDYFRTERTPSLYHTYFSVPRNRTVLAVRDGNVSAYAVTGKGRYLPEFIHDWGGEPPDLFRLARELTAFSANEDVYFLAPACENDLTQLLIDRNVPGVFMSLAMLNVIDVDGVSAIVRDSVSTRLGRDFRVVQTPAGVKMKVGREEAYIEPARMLAGVLFGPQPPSRYLKEFSQETRAALDNALPIPFFLWGLDWV